MRRDPKRLEHPKSVYIICLFVLMAVLFVLGGVINHFAFSDHGPELLVPLLERFQEKELPEFTALKQRQRAEAHRRFHISAKPSALPEGFQTDCTICHLTLPHAKTQKVRAVLNMHSNYLACETCHVEKKSMETTSYAWYSHQEKNPRGPFFGTAYDPESGELQNIHNHMSKIVPFRKIGGDVKPLLYTGQGDEAGKYMKAKEKYTDGQRREASRVFHMGVLPKGLECQMCHSLSSILDLKQLGFSEKRIFDLQNLSIQALFKRDGVTFHLPDLFTIYEGSDAE